MTVKIPDFEALRQNGLELIQKLAANTWTDHNGADPGVTLLEQLCYALTDLGYRVDFDIVDLLAGGSDEAYRLLFSPRQALSTQPVVFSDYRQVLIDSSEVKNAYIEESTSSLLKLYYAPFSGELLLHEHRNTLLPENIYHSIQLKGLTEVNIQKEETIKLDSDVKQSARTKLMNLRSLGTDIEAVNVLSEEYIKIQVDLELGITQNKEALVAKVLDTLYQYINPAFFFEKLGTFQQNQVTEDIFDGPSLQRGFLRPTQLSLLQKRTEFRRSDLVQALMNLAPEIKTIRSLNIALKNEKFSEASLDWVVSLKDNKAVVFDLEASEVSLFADDLPVTYDEDVAHNTFKEVLQQAQPQPLPTKDLDFTLKKGNNRWVSDYTSIRQHMPEVFGITPYGLPQDANNNRKAQANQLSAYLLFFEQILADYFAQLGNLPQLFSVNREEDDYQTYFSQNLEEDKVPAIEGIFKTTTSNRIKSETFFPQEADKNRSNRLLDHFLARFAEQFSDGLLEQKAPNNNALPNTIAAKRLFLKEYPELSAARGTAFNYNTQWNVSGTQKRIARLLGLQDYAPEDLSNPTNLLEGFYLLEHILLRPRSGDRFQEGVLLTSLTTEDPYSLQVSYIFHAIDRFAQESTQKFIERLLRLETPAHLQVKTYWLNSIQMTGFKTAQWAFLEQLRLMSDKIDEQDHQYSFRVARDYLMDLLFMYHTAYPNAGSVGIPMPIRDLPVPKTAPKYTENSSQDNDKWTVTIQIYYPQEHVTYRLCDRNRQPVEGVSPVKLSADNASINDPQEGNKPYILLTTPAIDQDQIYWIRAEKELTVTNPESNTVTKKALKYVFLTQPVRVRVGLGLVIAQATPAEIDYGTQATIQLSEIQANVDYRLYADLNGNGILERIDDGKVYNGTENGTIDITTQVTNGFKENILITIKGSRDGFVSEAEVSSVFLRVRAYTGLNLNINQTIVDYNNTTGVNLTLSNGLLPTQASVDYHLYYRPISDPEFVHHQSIPPANEDVLTLDNGEGVTVKVRRPAIPPTTNNVPQVYNSSPVSPINYQLVTTLSPALDGDSLVYDLSALNLKEDMMFLVVASKPDQIHPEILESNGKTTIGAILTKPDPSPTFVIDPDPVVSGTQAQVKLSGTQSGVVYYLEYSNGSKQIAKLYHDRGSVSPRRDGVGFSKIGVDFASGEPSPTTLALTTRNPIDTNKDLKIMAEKPQTGISIKIADVSFIVG